MSQSDKDQRIQNAISLFTSGQIKECLKATSKLAQTYPNEPFLYNLLGVASATEHQFEEAIAFYNKAIKLAPQYVEVLNNMGVAYNDWKKPDLALKILDQAIDLNPIYAEAYNNRGNAQRALSDLGSAIKDYQKAIEINPSYLDALSNLGNSLSENRDYANAKNIYKKALSLDPGNLELNFYMADCLFNNREYARAENLILEIRDNIGENAKFLNLYGKVLQKKGSLKALNFFKRSLKNHHDKEEVLNNIGTFLLEKRKICSAIRVFKKLLEGNRKNFLAKLNLSYCLLIKKDLEKGWRYYEYRWYADTNVNVVWPFDKDKIWKGEEGGELVLWREQGIGDDILFLGMAPEAKRKVSKLSVYVDPRLVPLCERSMHDIEFIPTEEKLKEKHFDYHLPMGSLPLHFRNSEEEFSKTMRGYLKADRKRVEALREELGVKGKRVVGISWKSFNGSNMENKNLNLRDLAILFKDLDITLVNLQYGDVEDELREFSQSTGVNILQCSSVDNRDDLDGLAALIELCDLVVSTSNVTIHLAGALGKETWVLLPFVSASWWLLDREDSVWYPSMKLFRQNLYNEWDDVLTNIKCELLRRFA